MSEIRAHPAWWKRPLPWVLLALLLAIGIGATLVLIRGTGSSTPTATATPSATPSPAPTSPSPTPTATAATPVPPNAATRLHYLETLQSGNTAVFATDFADTVHVLLYATECCGVQTRDQAISSLSYVNPGASTVTWNFTLDDATLAGYRSSAYVEYFPVNAIVGVSSDSHLVSFVPGGDGRIVKIFLSGIRSF